MTGTIKQIPFHGITIAALSFLALFVALGNAAGEQEKAAVIAYPVLAVRAQPSEKAALVAEIPFAESAAVLGYGGKTTRRSPASWARVRWSGTVGWVPRAYLIPGEELSVKDVTAEELAQCGKKCGKVLLKALATMVKLEPRVLRPAGIPYSLRSLKLERSDGETNCQELVGGMESLVFSAGKVYYSNITGTEGCTDTVEQTGTFSVKGTTLQINLMAGKRTEDQCSESTGKKEESPVRASSFRIYWIPKIGGFMTDDDIRSFDYSRTWFSTSANGFVTYRDGLRAFFCHADDDTILKGKDDAGCAEVFRKLVPEHPYRFSGYFRKVKK